MGAEEFDHGAALRARLAAESELGKQPSDKYVEVLQAELTTLAENPNSLDKAVDKMKSEGIKDGFLSNVVQNVVDGKTESIIFIAANKTKLLTCKADKEWACRLDQNQLPKEHLPQERLRAVDKH